MMGYDFSMIAEVEIEDLFKKFVFVPWQHTGEHVSQILVLLEDK